MSKLTIHSVIKKSNRISMKLSNAFGLATSTVDEEFDKLEAKFHYYEKLIKNRLVYYLESNNLITTFQSGFRANKCTIDNIFDRYY